MSERTRVLGCLRLRQGVDDCRRCRQRYQQTFRFRSGESDQGCRRRPKAKYDGGLTGAELTNTAAMIYIRFEPRTWLAGRRLMSMSTGVLRTASPIAEAMISLRLRWLRSLHRAAMTSSASRRGPANDYDRPDVFQLPVDTWPRSAFVERNLATDLSTFPPTPAGEAAGLAAAGPCPDGWPFLRADRPPGASRASSPTESLEHDKMTQPYIEVSP